MMNGCGRGSSVWWDGCSSTDGDTCMLASPCTVPSLKGSSPCNHKGCLGCEGCGCLPMQECPPDGKAYMPIALCSLSTDQGSTYLAWIWLTFRLDLALALHVCLQGTDLPTEQLPAGVHAACKLAQRGSRQLMHPCRRPFTPSKRQHSLKVTAHKPQE